MSVELSRLAGIPVLGDLSAADLERLANWVDEQRVPAGGHAAREGASGYVFFVIESGEARVIHDDREIARLGPGDFFGEAAIIGDGRRNASVVAESDLTLLAMFGTRFREMQLEIPELADRIEATMRERRGPASAV